MLGWIATLALAAPPALPPEKASWTAERWMAEADRHAEALSSIRYAVQRTTTRTTNEVKERWRHAMLGPTRFRIDYFGDTSRQIACDGRYLLDYLPTLRKAVRVDLATMAAPEVESTLRGVLQKVSVPGLRFGHAEGVSWAEPQAVIFEDKVAVYLEGTGEAGSGLRYTIDPLRDLPLRSELVGEGKVTVRTDVRDYQELAPGSWFPKRIEVWAPEAGGDVTVIYAISGVSLLGPSDADALSLTLDPAIPITAGP